MPFQRFRRDDDCGSEGKHPSSSLVCGVRVKADFVLRWSQGHRGGLIIFPTHLPPLVPYSSSLGRLCQAKINHFVLEVLEEARAPADHRAAGAKAPTPKVHWTGVWRAVVGRGSNLLRGSGLGVIVFLQPRVSDMICLVKVNLMNST